MERKIPSAWQLLKSTQTHRQRTQALRRLYRFGVGFAVLTLIKTVGMIHRIAMLIDELLFWNYRRVEVRHPLFIVGPPRSGTTMLHRIIANDQRQFSTFSLWELVFAPAICEKYLVETAASIDRQVGAPCARLIRFLAGQVIGSNATAHPTTLSDPEEDQLLLLDRFASFLLIAVFPHCSTLWNVACLDERVTCRERQRLMRYYKGMIQRHLYYHGPNKTYLAKNPTYSGWVRTLLEHFPDARFCVISRSVKQTIPSQLSSLREPLRWAGYPTLDDEIVQRFVELFADYQRGLWKFQRDCTKHQLVWLEYDQVREDTYQVVVDALTQLGFSLQPAEDQSLQRAARQAQQHRSQHQYSLAEFGLSAVGLEEQ